jgi:hypothetical protein
VEIYTIGFTQTTAERFFERLADAGVERLLDVRLNNSSQLAGFAKAKDLPYFLRELVGATYEHEPLLAPTQGLLDEYKKRKGKWPTYEVQFLELMERREIETSLAVSDFETRTALLCSEATAENCHRRLAVDDQFGRLQLRLNDVDPPTYLPVTDVRFYEADQETIKTALVDDVSRRLKSGVDAFLMLGLARAYRASKDDRERHWLQLNGLCLVDKPTDDLP